MSRSYRKQPFMSICGWSSRDKVFASRGKRRTQDRSISLEIKNGDFENFLLPHELECTWNNVYSWSSDGKKRYHGLETTYLRTGYSWNLYLEWKDVTEEEAKIMEVIDILDETTRYNWSSPNGPIRRTRMDEWLEHKDWPPLWWKRMMRK